MIKDFYQILNLEEFSSYPVWGHKVSGSTNYLLGANDPRKHNGGIIHSWDEARRVKDLSEKYGIKFHGYIPVNLYDDREGLSLANARNMLKEAATYMKSDTFSLDHVMITTGCTNDNIPTDEDLGYVIEALKVSGAKYISLGGSHYLGWLSYNMLPEGINEIRIGEYALFGTIPYHPLKEKDMGENAIEVHLTVIATYPDRNQILCSRGSTYFDAEKSKILTEGVRLVTSSTEYTILEASEDFVVGDIIKFKPDYHSLIKILKYAE